MTTGWRSERGGTWPGWAVNADGTPDSPQAIEDVKSYENALWYPDEETGERVSNGRVPCWSDDLLKYLFDEDYGTQIYCTTERGGRNLAAIQQQTDPNTITLCPFAFIYPANTVSLGSKNPTRGISIQKVLPRSATLYHELFHLILGNRNTPDTTYGWTEQQKYPKTPDTIPEDSDRTYADLYRRNP
ncbi:hypothetical protein N7490_008476 [Penicillium lividum]|nr:hypothetical protein N7490_008476 [Penicillium lividum]